MHNWFLYGSTGAQEFRYTVRTGIEGCLCMMFPCEYSKIAYPVKTQNLENQQLVHSRLRQNNEELLTRKKDVHY